MHLCTFIALFFVLDELGLLRKSMGEAAEFSTSICSDLTALVDDFIALSDCWLPRSGTLAVLSGILCTNGLNPMF